MRRARVIKAPSPADLDTPRAPEPAAARRVPRVLVQAEEQAAQLLEKAQADAAALLQAANAECSQLREAAAAAGRAAGYAELTALLLRQKAREAELDHAARERSLTLARLLAERLVGRALEHDPGVVADLATTLLDEIRGARQIQFMVHPEDAPILERAFAQLRVPNRSVAVTPEVGMPRGQLRVVSELGTFHADLGRRLDVLCDALRVDLNTP